MSNTEIAGILREMAALYEIEGVEFKPRAYEHAAQSVESLDRPLDERYAKEGNAAFEGIPGVGAGIAMHLSALLAGKHFTEYERLKKKTPVAVRELMAIEGVGPRTIKTLWETLRVRNLSDLREAIRSGKLAEVSGFGKKSAAKFLKAIAFLGESGGRRLLGAALPIARSFEKRLASFPEVAAAVAGGSIRRRKETIGDIDLLAVSSKPEETMRKFLRFPEISHVYGTGRTKTNARLQSGIDVDLRVVSARSFGAALNYFTGSKEHNVALRELALSQGWKLNEYGLFKGEKQIGGETEKDLYEKLGLRYIEPELREMTGEIEASRKGTLPQLVGYGDLRGDLQTHTEWTDGQNSIGEMAAAAQRAGLEYIAITDHSVGLRVAGGLDGAEYATQRKEIDEANERFTIHDSRFKILQGAEVNIQKDGSLDLPDAVLARLDIVGVAVHSHFDLPRREQTARVCRALAHPLVDILYHPGARIINRRKGIELEWDAVFAEAKRARVALEVDASPERLDLSDIHVKRCVEEGIPLVIDSDAHAPQGFGFLELGIAQARRGWAEKKDVLNALPLAPLLSALKKKA